MSKAIRGRTPGGGPLMTVLAVLIFLLPVLSLGAWVTMTPDGRASWEQAKAELLKP